MEVDWTKLYLFFFNLKMYMKNYKYWNRNEKRKGILEIGPVLFLNLKTRYDLRINGETSFHVLQVEKRWSNLLHRKGKKVLK